MRKKFSLPAILLCLFILFGSIKPVLAAHDWSVCEGDKITWNCTKYLDNPSITITYHYTVIITVSNYADWYGAEYINGTLDQNGTSAITFLNSVTVRGLAPSAGFWMNEPIDDPNVSIHFIATQLDLNSLKTALQDLATNPNYHFSESTNSQGVISFKFWGSGVDGSTSWTYTAVINYTSDMVLYSIDDERYAEDGSDTDLEQYTWRRTSYSHGTCLDDSSNAIPAFPFLLVLLAAMVSYFIYLRRYRFLD